MKPGYKRTEVAVIPEDWRVEQVGRQLSRPPKYGVNAPAIPFDSRYPTYIRITDITNDGRFADGSRVSVDHPDWKAYVLEPGDLVFARTGASVGKSYLYSTSDGALVFAGFLIRLSPDPAQLVPSYLSQYVRTQPYWDWVTSCSMRSGQPGVNARQFADLPIPIPPTRREQEAIAEALGDADALIESLEQILAKKRQLKQAAMQDLLTGKRRLPGFGNGCGYKQTEVGVIPEDWEVRAVIEMGRIEAGKALAVAGLGPQRPYLRTKNVLDGRIDLEDVLSMPMTDTEFQRFAITSGDVLLNEGQSLELVGRCAIYRGEHHGPCAIQNQLIRFRAYPHTSPGFAAHLFRHCQCSGVFASIATQTTSVAHLGVSRLQKLMLAWPETRCEQEAIAEALGDADALIESLEQLLAKKRQLKQAAMQDLLTGKRRLPGFGNGLGYKQTDVGVMLEE